MNLEEVIKNYGLHDYLDIPTGRIYKLSGAIVNKDGSYLVPVIQCETNQVIGHAIVNNKTNLEE